LLERGESPATEAALVKDVGTAFEREIPEVARRLVPVEASLDDDKDVFNEAMAHVLLQAPSYTIRGGTPEILRGMIARGTLKGKAAIGVRIGKVIDKYKMSKHVVLDIRDRGFDFRLDDAKVAAEAALDGLYVIRTSVPAPRLPTDDVVRSYKMLSQVERAFRSLKTIDLEVRPIRHWVEDRVKAHIFLCMLAHYVVWHMIEAWRPLLFCDEDQQAKTMRDPVAPVLLAHVVDDAAQPVLAQVDIDIGVLGPVRVGEPLEQQPVFHRARVRQPQHVPHHRPHARPSGQRRHPVG